MKVQFANNLVELLGNTLNVGDEFPHFRVVDNDLKEITNVDFNKTTVYLTIPSIDTGVCSLEVSKFMNYLKDLDVQCLVVSMDLPFALKRWCQANVSDKVVTASDFRYKMFGEATGTILNGVGLLTRAAFVVNENNEVIYAEYLENVHNEPNYDEILKML